MAPGGRTEASRVTANVWRGISQPDFGRRPAAAGSAERRIGRPAHIADPTMHRNNCQMSLHAYDLSKPRAGRARLAEPKPADCHLHLPWLNQFVLQRRTGAGDCRWV